MNKLCDTCRAKGTVPLIKRWTKPGWKIVRGPDGMPARLHSADIQYERVIGKQPCPDCKGKGLVTV